MEKDRGKVGMLVLYFLFSKTVTYIWRHSSCVFSRLDLATDTDIGCRLQENGFTRPQS